MIKFPDLYTQIIYDYLVKHDDERILYKNISNQFNISYPTIRMKIQWLADNHYIIKDKKHIRIIPHF